MIPLQLITIPFNSENKIKKQFICTLDSTDFAIGITKKQNDELTYDLTVLFHGILHENSLWSIRINNQHPKALNGNPIAFLGTIKFKVEPFNKETLVIQQTDDHNTSPVWIDVSNNKYIAYKTPPILTSNQITILINNAKNFKLPDNQKLKKIFYSTFAGVFLHAVENDEKQIDTIYYTDNENKEFASCNINIIEQCKCKLLDSKWTVKLPGDNLQHILNFPRGTPKGDEDHGNIVSFDKIPLKSIIL